MEEPMNRTVLEVQQEFANDSGFGNEIIYDRYATDALDFLKEKLRILIPDFVISEQREREIEKMKKSTKKKKEIYLKELEVGRKKIRAARNTIVDAIWIQRKYGAGDLIMSIVYVLLTNEIDENPLNCRNYSCHPLFRIRKCLRADDSSGCCAIFVDEVGRVYQNWNGYWTNNVLPKGTMIAPRNGIYSFNSKDEVNLVWADSPSSSPTAAVLNTIDTSAAFLGFGAALIPLGALALPVAAPLLAASVVGCVGTSVWNLARSARRLADRGNHEQSINVTNREARSAWIGVAGSAIGLGAGGATTALARTAARGSAFSEATLIAVNSLNVAAITTNAVGVGNSIVELILKKTVDGEKINPWDYMQLAASLALFTHSASNFQVASKIVANSRNSTISSYREGLSIRQRRMFNKMARETIRVKGETQGRIDILRGLGQIPDNKYFNNLYKIRKELNAKGIQVSFSPDGRVLLNDGTPVDSGTLRAYLQHGTGDNILQNLNAVPVTQTDPNSIQLTTPANAFRVYDKLASCSNVLHVVSKLDLRNCVFNLCEQMSPEAAQKLIDIAKECREKILEPIERRLMWIYPFEQVLWKIFLIARQINGKIITLPFLNSVAIEIYDKFHNYMEEVAERHEAADRSRQKCKYCPGYFSISDIK